MRSAHPLSFFADEHQQIHVVEPAQPVDLLLHAYGTHVHVLDVVDAPHLKPLVALDHAHTVLFFTAFLLSLAPLREQIHLTVVDLAVLELLVSRLLDHGGGARDDHSVVAVELGFDQLHLSATVVLHRYFLVDHALTHVLVQFRHAPIVRRQLDLHLLALLLPHRTHAPKHLVLHFVVEEVMQHFEGGQPQNLYAVEIPVRYNQDL